MALPKRRRSAAVLAVMILLVGGVYVLLRLRAATSHVSAATPEALPGSTGGPTGMPTAAWRVEAMPSLTIGRLAGDSAYLFQSICSVRLLPDGRIVVADGGAETVRLFAADGTFQKQLGHRGNGPGEFQGIAGMWLTPAGDIAVWDAGNLRITVFSPTGTLLRDDVLAMPSGMQQADNPQVFLGAYGNGDVALAAMAFGRPAGGSNQAFERWTLERFGLDGAFRGELGQVPGMLRASGSPVPFTPVPYAVASADSLFLIDGYDPDIAVLDSSGARGRTMHLPRVAMSTEHAWMLLLTQLRSRGRSMVLDQIESGRLPRDERVPQLAGLLLDDRGELWVKTYDPAADAVGLKHGWADRPGPGGEWRVVRPDGDVVAVVSVPAGVIPMDVRGDRLLGVALDSMDVERVVVDGIRR